MNNRNFLALLIAILFFNLNTLAAEETDSTLVNKKRLNTVIIGSGIVYSASLIALNNAWYNKERTTFHFFNDNNGWNQVDKCGHIYSAYQLSRISSALFLWTNMSANKSALWGSVMSLAFMTTIDVFDGFSSEYGFSWGDIAANTIGAGLFLSQELIFKEQKIKLKFSFHRSDYADLNPELLGNGYPEENLKDYNGQTYWLSFDIYAIAGKNPKIPKWLNLALGYGAEGMIYEQETDNLANGFESYRQYYLGIDFDLSHIKTKSKFVNTLFFILDMVKFPAPAIEWNKNGTNYHWLYF